MEGLSAEQILERMARAYAECRSYRDSGIVEVRSDAETHMLEFDTAFVRPSSLRFEMRTHFPKGTHQPDPWRRLYVMKGRQVFEWPRTGLLLLEGGAGHGVEVPRLLMPGASSPMRKLNELTEARVVAEHLLIDDAECVHLEGVSTFEPNVSLFIDRATFLLRRIEARGTPIDTPKWRSRPESRTTIRPEIDVAISEHDLRFDPPTHTPTDRRRWN